MLLGKKLNDSDLLEALAKELSVMIKRQKFYFRRNEGSRHALLIVAMGVGALVVVNVGTKWFPADQLSALTAFGGVLLGLIRWLRLEDQAKWHKSDLAPA